MDTIILVVLLTFLHFIINVTLSAFRDNFKIIAPFKLRGDNFNDCKDPIYKLEKGEYALYYKVHKYELGYQSSDDVWFYLIPLAFLFSSYGYIKNKQSFGSYTESDIENGKVNDLKSLWDSGIRLKEEEEEKNRIFDDKLSSINSEFIENYK